MIVLHMAGGSVKVSFAAGGFQSFRMDLVQSDIEVVHLD